MYKVQEVAKIAGVSVRTLHHYDSIGLLKPSNIGSNRYRYYNDEDLRLLQHILFFKEIGFSLKKIQEIVAEGFDSTYALTTHIDLLRKKKDRLESLISSAEQTLLENAGAAPMTNADRFAAFAIKKTDDDIKKYKMAVPELEAKVDADSPAATSEEIMEVSAEELTPFVNSPAELEEFVEEVNSVEEPQPEKEEEDLEEINREGNRIYQSVASLMYLPPEAAEVQKEMHAYFTLLNRFYDCTPKMFRGLADLYAADSRFANNIDQHGAGLANYLKEAMYVYASILQDA
ncbi:HTH-type transcriptional activator mta [Planococcus massiliensis]|uniref:HTH-type transcriptional activator mta n=1 Tax=Planococcus massiliensis TaxID=1499687 RepID=A0A098EHT3_9BACL|nr:MerR family transcriptional regulator [Planococcus massiliensis]CEG21823.1 HTH-type transcriptional activator mta [Planococcus massiliensis]